MNSKPPIDYDKISKKLVTMEKMSHKEVERFVYGLMEIESSFKELYGKLLNSLQNEDDVEKFDEVYWDIISTFKHILYHIKDGDLTRGHYVDADEEDEV